MSAREFFAKLGVTLPGAATGGSVSVRCFANQAAHEHDDRHPSCSVSLDTGQWTCLGCGAKGSAFDAAVALGRARFDAAELAKQYGLFPTDHEQSERKQSGRKQTDRSTARQQSAAKLPTEQQLAAWREALRGNERIVARLGELRGWTGEAIDGLELGLDGHRVTFPIRDANRSLVGVLRYAPNPDARSGTKMLAAKGSTRELFPSPETVPPDRRVFVVEGCGGDAVAWIARGRGSGRARVESRMGTAVRWP